MIKATLSERKSLTIAMTISSRVIENVPLKPLTTFKIGGPARFFFTAKSEEDVLGAICWAKQRQVPFFVLGGGSNILVADEGFPGLVVTLGGEFCDFYFDNAIVCVGAAVPLPHLGNALIDRGWGGFEFMCGIPGTVGGAVVMNAGTMSGEIKHVLTSVRVMTPEGNIKAVQCAEIGFGHRTSRFKNSREIILSATFVLKQREKSMELRERVRCLLADRIAKQPKNSRNCGSVFKSTGNGLQAWKIVDKAGFRGARIGDALVAIEHSNWIVNMGSATAADVKELIKRIQTTAMDEFGAVLEREVLFVPEDLSWPDIN